MKSTRISLLLAAAIAAVLVTGIYVLDSAAVDPPPPIAAEPLTARSVFVDPIDLKVKIKHHGGTRVVHVDDPSSTVVVRYTVQPGAQFPWHSHAGPVVVNIISGALTYLPEGDCAAHTYTAGQAFIDPGQGHVHTAFNHGSQPLTFIATFFAAPATGSLLIPADPAC
ncbi:MAG TPA: cupin domain-containing protein [Gaiellaceae bacterium]|nr:cupin domain-containing protein [Gaiellaceae bacterium]